MEGCSDVQCPPGAECDEESGTCICSEGFSDRNCVANEEDCHGVACHNNGSCEDSGGVNCQLDIHLVNIANLIRMIIFLDIRFSFLV